MSFTFDCCLPFCTGSNLWRSFMMSLFLQMLGAGPAPVSDALATATEIGGVGQVQRGGRTQCTLDTRMKTRAWYRMVVVLNVWRPTRKMNILKFTLSFPRNNSPVAGNWYTKHCSHIFRQWISFHLTHQGPLIKFIALIRNSLISDDLVSFYFVRPLLGVDKHHTTPHNCSLCEWKHPSAPRGFPYKGSVTLHGGISIVNIDVMLT